jgi:agmatine deiminase
MAGTRYRERMSGRVEDSYPARDGFAMPAEWAQHARTWMCWPCRPEAWGGAEAMQAAKRVTARVARAISTFEPVTMAARNQDVAQARLATKADTFATTLDDSWARDIGPTFLCSPDCGRAAVQWQFNAWGNKYRDFAEDAGFATRVAQMADVRLYEASLVCEGGAIHTDGQGTLITTEQCLLNSNRNPKLSRAGVEEQLALATGAQRILWLGEGFSDFETDGHVDNIACFVAPGKVLVGVPSSRTLPDYGPVMEAIRRLRRERDARGRTLEVIEIEQPQRVRFDWRGRLMQTSYVNFYLPNDGVIMPGFDDPNDVKAQAILADCFPGREILQVEVLDLVQGGGGIHCITQPEPAVP